MKEPDPETVRAALMSLLHAMLPEQREHAAMFLLQELERLYEAGGIPRPGWIDALRPTLPTLSHGRGGPVKIDDATERAYHTARFAQSRSVTE